MLRKFAIGSIVFGCSVVVTSVSALALRIDNPSPAADAAFGTGVAGLGDQNGDGVADFAVGAPGSDRVDIVSGVDRTVIRSIHDPEGRSGLNFGYAVARIGDLNGDGVDDVAVGAPGPSPGLALPLPCNPVDNDCPLPEWGRVFVFSGANGSLIRKILPTTEFFAFGFSLAALGDVTGDGIPDLAVGSPTILSNAWGEVYAFSGATGAQLWVFREPPYPSRQAIGSLGMFIATTGDVNGDGRSDVLAAAPFHDNSGTQTTLGGKLFVLSGASGALIRSHQGAVPQDDGLFGAKPSALGDQNADGIGDYVVGHRGGNEILLYNGSDGALIRSIPSPASAGSGWLAMARAGDRDGDGKDDLWVGVPSASVAVLINGQGAALLQESDPDAPAADALHAFGVTLSEVPDLNGDGKTELLIGKPGASVSGDAGAGAVYLVMSNRPPAANAGPDKTIAAGASCIGPVTLDGSASSDPDGDTLTFTWTGPFGTATGVSPSVSLPLGQHTVVLVVDDGHGGSDTDTVVIAVVDQTAPTISSILVNPSTLWPANHKMVAVKLTPLASDNCDAAPVCRISAVTSNEPENGLGDGDSAPDASITGDLSLELRAERAGNGSGRIYSIGLSCSDFSGNASAGSATVTVPKDRRASK